MIELPKRVAGPDAPQRVSFGNFDIMSDAEGRPLALGKGTFGRTYQACHRFLDTIVALKIINERYATNNDVRQRFLVEARAVARLSHPHIAKLYDFGEIDGVLHYAMEYCGGGSLADRATKEGKIPLRQVVEVGQQISGALKCAHAAGFIHRDLKPSNIMLTQPTGPYYTKLIDFGLVQPSLPTATGSIEHSADGARFLGTPLFASPEQLREEPLDVRTDLFALGITLWYLLLGRPPESGSSAEIAASRLSPESYSSRLAADMPAPLHAVISRLLEKDRKNRFATAQEVFNAFNVCAAALGFRRARDYTDAAAEWGEWEEEVAPPPAAVAVEQPGVVADVEPVAVETVGGPLGSEFKIVARSNDDFSGVNYLVEPHSNSGESFIAHVLHEEIVADQPAMERLRVHVAKLMVLDMSEIPRPQALRAYSDYHAIIVEAPKGKDLLSVLRTESVVPLIEVAPLLETIADACDRLTNSGLPGLQLAPNRIFLEWPGPSEAAAATQELRNARPVLYPRFLALSEAPELARMTEPEDVSSTMTTDMLGDPSRADNMCEHFGTLLYRMVAGRNCPITASLSSQAYVAVPGLSEQSNRLLSLVIAKQIERDSCGQVLREILSGEGIVPRVPGHGSAGFTARTGSTVVGATPPLVSRTPPRTATSSTIGSTGTRPLPSARPAPPPPPPIPPVIPPVQKTPTEALKLAEKPSPPAKISPVVPPPVPPAVEIAKPIAATPAAPVEIPKAIGTPAPRVEPLPVSAPAPSEPVVAKSDDAISKVVETPPVTAKIPDAPSTPAEPSPIVPEAKAAPEIITEARAPQAAPPAERIEEARKPEPAPPVPAPVAPAASTPVLPVATRVGKKKKDPKAAKTKSPIETQPAEEVEAVTEKIVRPAPVVLPSPVSPPPAPKPAAAQPAIARAPSEAAPQGVPWLAANIKLVGIGIAAVLLLSVGGFAILKMRSKPTATAASTKSTAPAAVTKPAPAPGTQAQASAAPAQTPAVVAKAESPKPAAVTRTVAGRYVGEVRPKSGSSASMTTAEREVSIDSSLTSGYVVDYAGDGITKIPVTGSSGEGGVYSGRVLFSSATGGQRTDETITIRPAQDNTAAVTFEGQEASGERYALEGIFHPWSDADKARLDKMLAERASPSAPNVTGPDEAKLAAERQAAANNAAKVPNIPKQQQNPSGNQSSGRSSRQSSGSQSRRSQQAQSRPAPAAPVRQKPAPQAPPKNPFRGTAPGG